ncbi:unnamed protein product, partial [Rhizoctonia solani]
DLNVEWYRTNSIGPGYARDPSTHDLRCKLQLSFTWFATNGQLVELHPIMVSEPTVSYNAKCLVGNVQPFIHCMADVAYVKSNEDEWFIARDLAGDDPS